MPFREKTAWVSLIVTPAIWGAYFWALAPYMADGALRPGAVGLFIGAVIALTVVHIVLAVILALTYGKGADAPMDERERLIDLESLRAGFYVLNTALVLVSGLWLIGASPLVMANGILAAMVLAEFVHAGGVVLGYRRGA
jgi:hypothetical protein